MNISEFHYDLPPELIAQEPSAERDASRMLVLTRNERTWSDSRFRSLPDYLRPNDLLVINNTRVFPARLIGERYPSGGRVEVMLVREHEPMRWEALVRPGRRLGLGARVRFGNAKLQAEVVGLTNEGLRVLRFECDSPFDAVLDELGQTPLPPYIKRAAGSTPDDRERYQTVYAATRGAIAAPTAGLHFTQRVMEAVQARGARFVEITLHVGYGTFEPVHVEKIADHRVAPERYVIEPTAAQTINDTRANGGRIVAVGTTTTRALESAVNESGEVEPGNGFARLTITGEYQFKVVDALLTNFHLPGSSLLLLVGAFAERSFVLDAYRHAVAARYRFYSYGDCMLIT
jgi:S-adenosylmethionine:tRNA ribosyltransferase-isomerase